MPRDSESTSPHLETARILKDWLREVEFDLQQPLRPFPTELYDQLREWILSQGLKECQLDLILNLLPTCTSAADKWYPRASIRVKRYIALYTTFLLYVDDRAEKDLDGVLPDFRRIASRSSMGLQSTSCQDAGIALWLDLIVSETESLFGPYSTGVISKGFVDFILGNMAEAGLAESLTLPVKFASRSSQFIRDKTGAGEVYAHFLFPEHLINEGESFKMYIQCVRAMIDIINHVNDILSFFKECVVGTDENTHIVNIAGAAGCAPQMILKQVCSEMSEAMKVVKNAFESMPQVAEIWHDFINGYIMWHIHHDRYRLKELGLLIFSDSQV
ncbi:trichodiene synthase (TRI5) domain-containing protein [Hirsutella rhossiliensis]|uniref:Trichodiene synthase (TRI5) domain-containing protein n=1 Tax=Hirsutella rhossiliensis TaxID=111463 RepID=A0A9P8SLR0_9HYPO|nr:trichodiene synthase (TRI5) domain-containing protein [Hirsutella rhossiliensis]KAH0967773.1 trichodiene synthase (TRI5) domain-containing protein [Hirsutella rhossiliensis]